MTGNKPFFPGTRAHSSFPGRGKQEQGGGGETPLNRIYGAPLEKSIQRRSVPNFIFCTAVEVPPSNEVRREATFSAAGVMTLFLRRATYCED